jgi:hypothetical protein
MAKRSQQKLKSSSDVYQTKLDRFARGFESENHLRRAIADLLGRMKYTGVRITHGALEKGKDIVFYHDGPFGEKRLFACVVKREPITGQADDHKNGAPTIVNAVVQGVINQIHSALDSPIADGRGKEERVDSVYVISPYECPPTTIESVKEQLQRSGQIHFFCGHALLELFLKHWEDFLLFDSNVLLSYLTGLRRGLNDDRALVNMILRKPFLGKPLASPLDRYVEPQFIREIHPIQLNIELSLDLSPLSGPRRYAEIKHEVKAANRVAALLETSPMWSSDRPSRVEKELLAVAHEMAHSWHASYRRHVASLRANASQSASRSSHGFAASGAFTSVEAIVPSEGEALVELNPSPDLVARAAAVKSSADGMLANLRSSARAASQFALASSRQDSLFALSSPEFLTYCQIADVTSVSPECFDVGTASPALLFDEDLLDKHRGSLLITGPAGYGKTAFCRWHTIRDAKRLVDQEASILPVYVPLHPLSRSLPSTFEDAFFPTDELKALLKQQASGQCPFERIRLYLDGLDEVTLPQTQEEILALALKVTQELPFVQVILTTRDHVVSSGLKWLPRIRLRELSDDKVDSLAMKWLEADRIQPFFARLKETGSLAELMRIPLMGTLILAVYRKTAAVPPNKTELYSLFVELLCGGWDYFKEVQRRESYFSSKDKTVVLARLAGILHHQNTRDGKETDFRAAVKNTLPMHSPNSDGFLQEVIEDGLLVRTSGVLTFSHLSFQEFLAARDLSDHSGTRARQTLSWYLKGDDWWREVLGFYVTLSERPGDTDEWLLKRALESTTGSPDLLERVQYLRQHIKEAFPAYQEARGAMSLIERFRLKASVFNNKSPKTDDMNRPSLPIRKNRPVAVGREESEPR